MPSLRSVLSLILGTLLFAAPAAATWSIVVVNLATGEVAIGIATCLTGFDLRPNTVVVVPGYGAAAAQSFVGPLSLRELIRDGFLSGDSAAQILANLAAADSGHQSRQYGIVSLTGGEEAFTGSGAGSFAGGLVGQTGNLRYAIQGNVLTGQPVIAQAEQALINTPGSLPDKLMAAMEAARAMGGDGRCSCSAGAPTSCGAPPPSFTKSSHIGLMIVSRPSDVDAPCNFNLGCGAGDYWLDLNVANQSASAVDPVIQLQALYNTWKANQVGRPDHYESLVTLSSPSIRANGIDVVTATVELRDAQGAPVGNALPLTVELASNSTVSNLQIGPVTPQANGTYTFTVQGGLETGVAVFDIATTDTFGRVGLWPRPMVSVTDMFGACGDGAIPDGQGGALEALTINGTTGVDRVVQIGYSQPFTISLAPPVGAGGFPAGLFALWLQDGIPDPATALPISSAGGTLCFTPSLLSPAAPNLLLADSFGLGGIVPASAAPWDLAIPGLPVLLDASLQGAMIVDSQGSLAATNAVHLRLQALPDPVITSISPEVPTTGQLVTVTGSEFFQGIVGRVGGIVVPVNYVSATEVTFSMPAGVPCDALLELGNLGGSAGSTLINATPTITSLPISTSPAAGGGNVFIIGTNMLGATATIGGVPLQVATQTPTLILAVVPPGPVGATTLVVESATGCQDTATFTYF